MTVVLDTHTWLWWVDSPNRLSAPARRAIEEADQIRLSSISCWELATLVRLRRIEFDRDVRMWIRQALAIDRVTVTPVSSEIAIDAGSLPAEFPGDPADRVIYATARSADCPLITRDRVLRAFDSRRTVW